MGGMTGNRVVILRVMVSCLTTDFLSGALEADGEAEGEADSCDEGEGEGEASVSPGGILSAEPVVSSEELPPPKKPFSFPGLTSAPVFGAARFANHTPAMLSSFISPYAIASEMETRPDSDSVSVAFTTGSVAPRSVKFPIASATPLISASKIN